MNKIPIRKYAVEKAMEQLKDLSIEFSKVEAAIQAFLAAEADHFKNQWMNSFINKDRIKDLENALQTASDDLAKAANQFKGLYPDGNNWHIFETKSQRAKDILKTNNV